MARRENVLRQYPSYAYGLSLHLLLPGEYNNIVTTGQYTTQNVLIASAGRHGQGFPRNRYFKDDFYFEDLELETVMGMASKTRSTNAVQCSFKFVEPYGMTFLSRLLLAIDQTPQRGRSWLELPYMLQIDFFGYTDDGIPTSLPDLTKYIPIKISNIKMVVTHRGAEYSIKAAVYHDSSLNESMGALPSAMELSGGTVTGILNSLGKALNDKQRSMVETEKVKEYPDEYYFELEGGATGDLGRSTITVFKNPGRNPPGDVRSATRSDSDSSSVGNRPPSSTPPPGSQNGNEEVVQRDPSSITQQFNAGTSIVVVLENLFKSSSYFRNQIELNVAQNSQTDPIKWVRILPKVEVLEGKYDRKTNRYAKKITYKIQKYELYNNKYPLGPQGKTTRDRANRIYEYIYTGKNSEILDFTLEFDAMFYTFVTIDRARMVALGGTGDGEATGDIGGSIEGQTKGQPPITGGSAANQTSTSSDGNKDQKAVAASDLLNSMVSGSKGDMVNVKLKIHGDPDFIKQDNVFNMAGNAGSSIPMDTAEVYVYLSFKTPVDINEQTGLYDFTGSFNDSGNSVLENFIFNGLYRCLVVKSSFRSGRFEQELTLTRLFHLKEDYVPPKS